MRLEALLLRARVAKLVEAGAGLCAALKGWQDALQPGGSTYEQDEWRKAVAACDEHGRGAGEPVVQTGYVRMHKPDVEEDTP